MEYGVGIDEWASASLCLCPAVSQRCPKGQGGIAVCIALITANRPVDTSSVAFKQA